MPIVGRFGLHSRDVSDRSRQAFLAALDALDVVPARASVLRGEVAQGMKASSVVSIVLPAQWSLSAVRCPRGVRGHRS
ncbi:hypothetical protein [Rhodanobacter sp. MP1X3]|uniref:hypothetical protein n=1 Tax=Rhodanobacter sp. MP1X3 TaxID=2723086 RepID=UPI0016106270|nr:hypothetical protein [Rhodanobacter sp. MP1X3]MBB6244688.1 hypothetical protein [Rhodanobacter sp. MP1X3]